MKFQYKEKKNSLKEISGGKDEIMPFIAIRMDLETIIVSDVSQTVKDERHMISPICGVLKKKWIQFPVFRKQTDFEKLVTKGDR